MATYTADIVPTNATDAQFRAWVQWYITAITSVGMVQTADTGQINTSTVVKPAAINTVSGYAVFRFDDALQATAPIFIKVEFGSGGHIDVPNLYLTVGKSTDGAGTVGGVLLARTRLGQVGATATASTTAYASYASGGSSRLTVVPAPSYNATAGPTPAWFIIERSRDSTGAATDAAIAVIHPGSAGTVSVGVLSSATAAGLPAAVAINYATGAQNVGVVPVIVPYTVNGTTLATDSSLSAGSIGPVFPWVMLAPAAAPWQALAGVSFPAGDNPSGLFTTTLYGAERTLLSMPLTNNTHGFGFALTPVSGAATASRYVGLAILWE